MSFSLQTPFNDKKYSNLKFYVFQKGKGVPTGNKWNPRGNL